MTRPAVVKGLKFFAQLLVITCIAGVFELSALKAANLGGFRGIISKLRYQVVRIQRCWRGYKVCSLARLRAIETKFALVERRHRLELMDTVRRAAVVSKNNTMLRELAGVPRRSPKLYLVEQEAGHKIGGAFDRMKEGAKEALIGVRKSSPASDGRAAGKDCTGALASSSRQTEGLG